MTVAKRLVASSSLLKQLSNIDHRSIGLTQDLFFFNEHSKGSCFFKPRGAHIYNKLIDYLRVELKKRKYNEVITPNIYDCRLWEKSGHWEHYKDNMIRFNMGEHEFSLKPMNCPGHCLMYQQLGVVNSAKLPIRWADFGALHRNELSGSLMGLTRVRRFQQDDAHIFCTPEQVGQEVADCLDFASKVYGDFGFSDFELMLSLRPQKFMGDTQVWDQAEDSLRQALVSSKLSWSELKDEGAFYGPKIDLVIKDSHQRSHQCATIQLDFQLPNRFDLLYKDLNIDDCNEHAKSFKRPVMIHRAILGSIERFIAMVAENSGGRWPFWLSPIQIQIVPVSDKLNDYALAIEDRFVSAGLSAECELNSKLTFNKKIRNAVVTKYNFIIVVGDREAKSDSVTVRVTVDKKTHQIVAKVDKVIELFENFSKNRVKQADKEFLSAFA